MFSKDVSSPDSFRVRILPSCDIPEAETGDNFTALDLVARLGTMPRGALWLLEEAFPGVASGATGCFTKVSAAGEGRAGVHSKVQFGGLVLQASSQEELTSQIAIKQTSPYLAAREFGAMRALNARGMENSRPRSFVPLGFYRAVGQAGVSLVTKHDQSVVTLDTLLWNKDDPPTEPQMRAALSHSALALGDLHSWGMTSGDAQPKNIGADSWGIRYPDLEAAQEFEVTAGVVDPARVRRIVEQDLDTLLRTLGGDHTDLLRQYFAGPYNDSAQADGSALPAEVRFSAAEIVAIGSKPQYEIADQT